MTNRDDSGRFARFPTTRASAIARLGSADDAERRDALGAVLAAYWKPSYKYVRLRFGLPPEEAEDLVQDLFGQLVERDRLRRFAAERGRFRTFVRACLEHAAIDRHRAARAAKRGGGAAPAELEAAERELAAGGEAPGDPEALFEREWIRRFTELARARLDEALRARGKREHAEVFALFHGDDEPPSYAAAAARLGLPVTTITNRLSYARREFRVQALALLRELTADDAEFEAEARALLGVAP